MNIYTDKSVIDPYPESQRIDYPRFQNVIYPVIKGNSKLGPLVIWEQIKLYIKGSAESTAQHSVLTVEQYCDERHFPTRKLKLNEQDRLDAYAAFERYQAFQWANNLWDDCDKANGTPVGTPRTLSRQLSRKASSHTHHSSSAHTLARTSSQLSSKINSPGIGSLSRTSSQLSPKISFQTPLEGEESPHSQHQQHRTMSRALSRSDSHDDSPHASPHIEPETKKMKRQASTKLARQASSRHHITSAEPSGSGQQHASGSGRGDVATNEKTCWTGVFCL